MPDDSLCPHVRPMNSFDINAALAIDRACFPQSPWIIADFVTHLHHMNCFGRRDRFATVAEVGGHLVGYVAFAMAHNTRLHIDRIAVHPGYHGQGIGRRLALGVVESARAAKFPRVTLRTRESNLAAQLAFRSWGWRWVKTERGEHYADTGEDAYVFAFMVGEQLAIPTEVGAANRPEIMP